MKRAKADKTGGPTLKMERSDDIQSVVRRLLQQKRSSAEPNAGCVAVISAHPGAGTTFVCEAITACINKAAMEREATRMASTIAEAVSSGTIYGAGSRMVAAIQKVVVEAASCTDPSRLAVTLDYRRINRPGAEFGAVVADSLRPEVLCSDTEDGRTVKEVLDGLPVEWDSMSSCRRECLRSLGSVFELVVIDVPSRKESSDLQSIVSIVSGVIVVVEANKTTRKDLTLLTGALEAAGGNVLGYVLNKQKQPIPQFVYSQMERAGLV